MPIIFDPTLKPPKADRRYKLLTITDDCEIECMSILNGDSKIKGEYYWTEPELPKDLKIVKSVSDYTGEITRILLYSETFEKIPPLGNIPELLITVHRGKKPTKPFLFR